MSIVTGANIGPYEILLPLGAGGMGEVYRARDTRLNREVAIKVLPRAFAEDPMRMARFEREAQLLASLNHPKIAAIYGLEESGATRALVMELVEGPTLAERIGRAAASARPKAGSVSPAHDSGGAASGGKAGARSAAKSGSGVAHAHRSAIPLDDALPIAQQVAEALEYAHEHGVVHRDLKPANIKVTPDGDVKVLDFGLAKAMGPESASGDMSNSPTLSLAMTEAGLIIGTAAYMAPEQAKGKTVDRRADVWAFGCVLYEMLTGQKAFEGETVSDVLAAVIMKDPDWAALPETTPPAMQRLVRRCLQKDVRQRLQAIGDARIAIEEVLSGEESDGAVGAADRSLPDAGQASWLGRVLPWALGTCVILLAALAAWLLLRPAPQQNVVRFAVPQPQNAQFIKGGMTSISPDGRMLAFVAEPGPGKAGVLWLRPIDRVTAQPIPGTDGASRPFWSPDSQQVGFVAEGKLEKVAVSGGPPQTLCDAQQNWGGTWSRDGVILFSNGDGLYRVPDTGGTPTLVLALDPAHEAAGYSTPQFLPDGRHFLVTVRTPGNEPNILGAGSLDSKAVKHLAVINSQVYYAPPGYVIYQDQSTLMARRFDAKALRFEGPALPIIQNVGQNGPSYGYFSVSSAGVLAYQSGGSNDQDQMAWFDRKGQKLGTVGPIGLYTDPRLSPDGSRLAVVYRENMDASTYDIWVYDLKRNTSSRLTFAPTQNDNPVWSHDGSRIFFTSYRNGKTGIYEKPADGLGNAQLVFQSGQNEARLMDLSPDGRYAMYVKPSPMPSLWVWALAGGGKPFAWAQGSFAQGRSRFSPDGRYVAYLSLETGKPEVYVQTFPQHLGKWQISNAGGNEPEWRSDGKELFYLGPNNELMSVDVTTGAGTFQAGVPKVLFEQPVVMPRARNSYAVSPDGQRFLMLVPPGQEKPEPITVVVNWPALLKK